MAKKTLNWKGDKVLKTMEKAAHIGVNQTMGDCVKWSKGNHPWIYRTGMAERSIRISVTARKVGGWIIGLWGSVNVLYFGWLEKGTPSGRKAYPTLVPASKIMYPRLAGYIKKAFK